MLLFVCTTVSLLWCTCVVHAASGDPAIKALHVLSRVYSRFATVTVTSRITNDALKSKTAMFSMQVPEEAFINSFSMESNNKIMHGVVKEKAEAEQAYRDAQNEGQTAGTVVKGAPPPGRAMKNFVVYMNVAAQSEAIFKLSYQELIKKILGKYTQKIHLEPDQLVDNITVVCSINEPQGMEEFWYSLPGSDEYFSSSSGSKNTKLIASETKREFVYTPTLDNQVSATDQNTGIKGDITLKYVLTPPKSNGGVLVVNAGAFVHYFSPSSLPSLSKTIVFVIDISGSMRGRKIEQVKTAMGSILHRLRENDVFNIIVFDNNIKRWLPEPVMVDKKHVSSAKAFVKAIEVGGSTDINSALLAGVHDLTNTLYRERNRGSILVFLTDGVQTAGELSDSVILANVQRENHDGLVSIFCLGFGHGVHFQFLKKIAMQNHGTAHMIYDGEDASEQLDDFYRGIESITLRDVTFEYPTDIVVEKDITETHFANFFNGSEIVVAGNLQQNVDLMTSPLTANVVAVGFNNDVNYHSVAEPEVTGETQEFAQRLWAYKKIQEYLDLSLISDDMKRKRYESKALELALRYGFVTRLTSMVVTESVHSGTNSGVPEYENVMYSAGQNSLYSGQRGILKKGVQVRSYDNIVADYSSHNTGSSTLMTVWVTLASVILQVISNGPRIP